MKDSELPTFSDDQIAGWQADLERERADSEWAKEAEAWLASRSPDVLDGLRALLSAYLNGTMPLKDVQIAFDKRTRTEWNIMGLKGLSGAMFLNTLAKHIPDQHAADAALKEALPVPQSTDDGAAKMMALVGFVDGLVASGTIAKSQVQSARIPFFLSAWWQIQDREMWPVYYSSMRAVYERRNVWKPGHGSLVEDYMAFRSATRSLAEALGLDAWGIERLCLWLDRPAEAAKESKTLAPVEKTATLQPVVAYPPAKPATAQEGTEHTHVQWLLAKLGRQLNLKVWIAQNDRSRIWQGETLGSYSIASLPPLGIGEAAQQIVRLIDVIWLKGANQVVAAFEVEATTSIFSGLLRMSDLTALAPNSVFPIYVVAPEAKLDKVRAQLKRPTFQRIELHQRCRFFAIEKFIEQSDAMLAWASDPAAIDKIAERVGDVDDDAVPVTDDEELDA